MLWRSSSRSARRWAARRTATTALDKIGSYLRSLDEFTLTATTTSDDVLEGGFLVETGGRTVYDVHRLNRMRIDVTTDGAHRIYYYDGRNVTQFAPALGFYSVRRPLLSPRRWRVPPTQYDVQLPLADRFLWGSETGNDEALSEAHDARIADETCTHYAYRTDNTDVQVWIRKHGNPLPCRLVIVTTNDDARRRYSATLEWDLDPLLADTTFPFAPTAISAGMSTTILT